MRSLSRAGVVTVASCAALLVPAAGAFAGGDNGDVKTHRSTTGEFDQRDEPKVCSFYLDAFHFDGLQKVDWHIEAWAVNATPKGETVKTGSITLDGKGHGRTQDLSLPDGQYKLFWTFEGEKGAAKHKVFKVDCGDGGGTGGSPSASASSSATSSASSSATSSASSSATSSPSGSASASRPGSSSSSPGASGSGTSTAAPTSAPSGQGGGGDLAETGNGAPVGVLSAAAAALVAGGAFLVLRRRRGQHR
ncbi:LPXTG cell wall anchor domain-containing protein [Streptomyces galbus]|uniref:LPXTG cell wall anchor domain-containing protein n=1 Tax=Streptomyces galbus TaxID=33898 RepID=A0A4U5WXF5_STRGB|nr:LPXTG cell wall anchor domain-containing protein [Streptomyces galbus]TKT07257.1 LPXTG cell wall anchor domain-containing protein [Streptomyces galbus]